MRENTHVGGLGIKNIHHISDFLISIILLRPVSGDKTLPFDVRSWDGLNILIWFPNTCEQQMVGMYRSVRRRSISADIPIIGFDRRSQNGRSDDVTSATTIRDVSIAAQRNGDNAPSEGRRVQRSTRGSSRTERRPPSWISVVNSADTHMSAPIGWCSR